MFPQPGTCQGPLEVWDDIWLINILSQPINEWLAWGMPSMAFAEDMNEF